MPMDVNLFEIWNWDSTINLLSGHNGAKSTNIGSCKLSTHYASLGRDVALMWCVRFECFFFLLRGVETIACQINATGTADNKS